MNVQIGFNSIPTNNTSTIIYAYDKYDGNGTFLKGNTQESFMVLPSDTELIAALNVVYNKINLKINPPEVIILGNIIVKYVDMDNIDIQTPDVFTDLRAGTYFYYAKAFVGYTLNSSEISTKSATILADNLSPVVTFNYTKDVIAPE